MESIAVDLIYLESIMFKDLISDFSWPDHSTTTEYVLHASDLNVVKLSAGLAMQAEV